MVDYKKQSEQVRDYKERFEFKLTVGNNIICQRYFRINNFNPRSLKSYELMDVIRNCAKIIDKDLVSKTQSYLEVAAPMVFNTADEMHKYFSNENNKNRMGVGQGISIKNSAHDYYWGKNHEPIALSFKFDDNDFSKPLTDEDRINYKFAFCVDGKEVCSTVWEGVYPKYVRNSIDLSNKRGKHEGEDISRLSFEQYLDYKIVEGRNELVWGIIKDICTVCSSQDNSWYTTTEKYGNTVYNNLDDNSIWVDKYGNKKVSKNNVN